MLIYIECEHFAEKRVNFQSGLNIVCGDEKSSNSIGKSNFLKVIDFVFGGDTFLSHSKDVLEVLGHHSYEFGFVFDGETYTMSRSTERPNEVLYIYRGASPADRMPLSKYLDWLRSKYCPYIEDLSFRGIVSPVSRMWGKDYIEVSKPLHNYRAQGGAECVDYLIKVFKRFGEIADVTARLEKESASKAALNKAFSTNLIKKISKDQYEKNRGLLDQAEIKLDEIRENLSVFALSINELVDQEVLSLKLEKNKLLTIRSSIFASLSRTRSSLNGDKRLSRDAYEAVRDILPGVNIEKIEKIESFHVGIVGILKRQIKEKESELLVQLDAIDAEISDYNKKISIAISQAGNPSHLVDSVADLTLQVNKVQEENERYEQAKNFSESIRELKLQLRDVKEEILSSIEDSLNSDIEGLVEFVYGEKRSAPKLSLDVSSYAYTIPQDTGTGKAYVNLVLFDCSLLRHTEIPFLIHDSILFKNIEDAAMVNVLGVYGSLARQAFIALDGSVLDDPTAKTLIESCSVLCLSATRQLYVRDWRLDSD